MKKWIHIASSSNSQRKSTILYQEHSTVRTYKIIFTSCKDFHCSLPRSFHQLKQCSPWLTFKADLTPTTELSNNNNSYMTRPTFSESHIINLFNAISHYWNYVQCQHPTSQFFTGRMPFLPPNQQRQSTEGTHYWNYTMNNAQHTSWFHGHDVEYEMDCNTREW